MAIQLVIRHNLEEHEATFSPGELRTFEAREIRIAVAPDGRYSVNRVMVDGITVEALMVALKNASQGQTDRQVIVSADAMSAHQSVINVLDAARRIGLTRVTFAAQGSSRDAVRR